MFRDYLLQYIPDLAGFLGKELLGSLNGGDIALLLEPLYDEGLEKLQSHLFGQSTLVELELWSDNDDRAAGIVDPLTQQILPEPSLLSP